MFKVEPVERAVVVVRSQNNSTGTYVKLSHLPSVTPLTFPFNEIISRCGAPAWPGFMSTADLHHAVIN